MKAREISSLVAGNLKRLRAAKGWTQERLAEELGVTVSYIARIETSKGVGRAVLSRLCKVFEVHPGVFYQEQESGPANARAENIDPATASRLEELNGLLRALAILDKSQLPFIERRITQRVRLTRRGHHIKEIKGMERLAADAAKIAMMAQRLIEIDPAKVSRLTKYADKLIREAVQKDEEDAKGHPSAKRKQA